MSEAFGQDKKIIEMFGDGHSRESSENRERIAAAVIAELQREMERMHGGEAFHNPEHPRNVERDAGVILDIFERYSDCVTPDVRLGTKTATAGHDADIEYTVVEDTTAWNYGQRVRHRGFGELMPESVAALPGVRVIDGRKVGNEELSWLRMERLIEDKDPDGAAYTPEIRGLIKAMTAATFPDAAPVPLPEGAVRIRAAGNGKMTDLTPYLDRNRDGQSVGLRFTQPFLKGDSHPGVFAIACGDLKYGGKKGFEEFRRHGNEEYREVNELISREIAGGIEQIPAERKAAIARSALEWMRSQIGFLLWQKTDFANKLEDLQAIRESRDPEALKRDLHQEYGYFDDNLVQSARFYEEARKRFASLIEKEIYARNPDESAYLFAALMTKMGYQG